MCGPPHTPTEGGKQEIFTILTESWRLIQLMMLRASPWAAATRRQPSCCGSQRLRFLGGNQQIAPILEVGQKGSQGRNLSLDPRREKYQHMGEQVDRSYTRATNYPDRLHSGFPKPDLVVL